jgi:hypothetical protein
VSAEAARAATPARPAHGPLLHVVLIRLAEPGGTAGLLREADERLRRIPSVVGLQVGTPVDIGRAGVDLDFDVGIVVSFDGPERYREYLAHPEHVALVEAWKPLWSAIRIVDLAAGGTAVHAPAPSAPAATR